MTGAETVETSVTTNNFSQDYNLNDQQPTPTDASWFKPFKSLKREPAVGGRIYLPLRMCTEKRPFDM